MPSRSRRSLLVALYVAGLAAALHAAAAAAAEVANTAARASLPRLLVLLVADQGRYDYFERLRPHVRDGLARVLGGGARFENAAHDHAITNTGPGHAAIVSGMHPSHSAIVDNSWFDRAAARRVDCVEDPNAPILPSAHHLQPHSAPALAAAGRSPANLAVTALPDWIKAADPRSKAFAVAGKDRAAVLLGGKRPDGVYWYAYESGRFVTSRYYATAYPDWAEEFRRTRDPAQAFGSTWQAVPTSAAVARAFGVLPAATGTHTGFPHLLGGPSTIVTAQFYADFGASGLMTAHQMQFVEALVVEEELGQDDSLDYLGVGFSEVDLIGHEYGPNSSEVLDVLLRIDAAVGDLLRLLDRSVGRDRYAVVLTSDHGVMPLPEQFPASRREPASDRGSVAARARGAATRAAGHRDEDGQLQRLDAADGQCFQRLQGELEAALGAQPWLLWDLYLDYDAVARSGLQRDRVEQAVRSALEGCDAVAQVWTRSELEAGTPALDRRADQRRYFEQYVHAFFPARSPDALVQLEPNRLAKLAAGTTHGTPYRYDSHVPMVIWMPGIEPRAIAEPVRTVDLAPTLAELLAIKTPGPLDGVSRVALLRGRR